VLAEFRADYTHSLHDAQMNVLLDSLRSKSPLFAKAWSEQVVLDRAGGLRTFSHAGRGVSSYYQHTFRPSDRPDHMLVTLVPAAAAQVS
jgi:hypothetical protein